MSKIAKALEKIERDRHNQKEDIKTIRARSYENALKYTRKGAMKNSWLIIFFILGVILTVFMAFRHQADNQIPFSEIFPEEGQYPIDIEYEFVDAPVSPDLTDEKIVKNAEPEPPPPSPSQNIVQKAEEVIETLRNEPAPEIIKKAMPVPAKLETPPPVLSQDPDRFAIQVASFKKLERAQVLLKELVKKDYDAYVVQRDLGPKGVWYRVYVGKFDSKKEAEAFIASFKPSYKNSFIISPKKK